MCATAPAGKPVPGYEAVILDEHGGRCRMARRANWWCAGRPRPRATGTSGTRRGARSAASGRIPAIPICAMPTGYYRYCGRSDEMLKVSGVWVSPFEVEEALISHPAVLEAAVVGAQDPDGLIKPKAFVVLQERGAAAGCGDGDGAAEDACEGADRRVEISALDRVRRTACRRPRPARSSASGCGKNRSRAS